MLTRIEQQDNELNEEADFEEIDSDDESVEDSDLAQRLNEVDLNNADEVWDRLSFVEKEEFTSMVANNEVYKIIPPVESWWSQKLLSLPVIDVEANQKKLNKIYESCPKISNSIQDFSKISPKLPAKCVIYNIASVIATYTYIFRYYNGDHTNYILEATNNFIIICDNLKANVNYENINAVIDSIMLNCHNQNLYACLETKILMTEDVKEIFEGPCEYSNYFLLSALSDITELFMSAKLNFKTKSKNKKSSREYKKFSSEFPEHLQQFDQFKELQNLNHFNNCLRKLEFYLSFIKNFYNCREWPVEF